MIFGKVSGVSGRSAELWTQNGGCRHFLATVIGSAIAFT